MVVSVAQGSAASVERRRQGLHERPLTTRSKLLGAVGGGHAKVEYRSESDRRTAGYPEDVPGGAGARFDEVAHVPAVSGSRLASG